MRRDSASFETGKSLKLASRGGGTAHGGDPRQDWTPGPVHGEFRAWPRNVVRKAPSREQAFLGGGPFLFYFDFKMSQLSWIPINEQVSNRTQAQPRILWRALLISGAPGACEKCRWQSPEPRNSESVVESRNFFKCPRVSVCSEGKRLCGIPYELGLLRGLDKQSLTEAPP